MIVILLFAVSGVMAQKGERGGRAQMKDMTPEQIATLQTKKATLALDLTQAQQKQLKSLFIENAKMRKAKMAAKEEGAERKKPSPEEHYARANERLDHQIAQKAKLKQILSEEQYAKWEQMKKRKGKRGKAKKGKKQERPKKRSQG